MLKVRYQKQFKKDLRKMLKQPKYTEEQFVRVLTYLVEENLFRKNIATIYLGTCCWRVLFL